MKKGKCHRMSVSENVNIIIYHGELSKFQLKTQEGFLLNPEVLLSLL